MRTGDLPQCTHIVDGESTHTTVLTTIMNSISNTTTLLINSRRRSTRTHVVAFAILGPFSSLPRVCVGSEKSAVVAVHPLIELASPAHGSLQLSHQCVLCVWVCVYV